MSESQKKLFKGQNTHPLSQAEKQALAKKIKFKDDVSAEDQKKVYAAFKEMMNYPTGREQIRRIIAFKQKDCVIDVAAGMGINGGASADGITLAKEILENPQSCGMTLFHELLHVRQVASKADFQKLNVDQFSGKILLDEAEPHALTNQLACEMNHNPDVMYKAMYEKSLDKWHQVANGKQPRPQNIPALTYEPNLTAAEKAQAREAYAQLLASLECRGQATKDFVKPINEIDENLSSYYILYRSSLYMRNNMNGLYGWGRETNFFKDPKGDPESHEACLKEIASRNPLFVSVDDLKKATISGNNDKEKVGFMTIAREAQDRLSKGEGNSLREVWDKIIQEKEAKGEKFERFRDRNAAPIPDFMETEGNPAQEGETDPIQRRIKLNEAIMKTDLMDDNQKRMDLMWFIHSSKSDHPEKREDRTDAIKKLRELTGNPNLPIVKTSEEASIDSQVQDALRKAGNPVPADENQVPVVKDKSLMA